MNRNNSEIGQTQAVHSETVEEYKSRLSTHEEMLLDTIEPRFGLIQVLASFGLLSPRDCSRIVQEKDVYEKNVKLLEYMMKKTKVSDFVGFRNALVDTRQQHVANYIDKNAVVDSSCGVRPLTKEELFRINRCKLQLMELMDANVVIDHLAAEGCLNTWQRQRVNREEDEFSKNELLLDIFSRKSFDDFQRLIFWLENTRQSHVAKLLDGVLVAIHVSLDNDLMEDEVLCRWKEMTAKRLAAKRLSEEEWREVNEIMEELRRRDLEIVHCELGQSITMWIWCRTHESVRKLKWMWKVGNLNSIVTQLIYCLMMSRSLSLSVKLKILPEDMLQAESYFVLHRLQENERNESAKEICVVETSKISLSPPIASSDIHVSVCNNNEDSSSLTLHIGQLPYEVLELLLLRTTIILTLWLWKLTSSPDPDVFTSLASVCSTWHQAMTGRRWFRRAQKQLLERYCSPFLRRIQLVTSLQTKGRLVMCVTELNNNIYAILHLSNSILVYSQQPPYQCLATVPIKELVSPVDMVACSKTEQLYISDRNPNCVWCLKIEIQCVLDVTCNSEFKSEIPYTMSKFAANFSVHRQSLSVSGTGDVLVTDPGKNELFIYNSQGEIVTTISLDGTKQPWHAIRTSTETYIVCYGTKSSLSHVCEIDKTGKTLIESGVLGGSFLIDRSIRIAQGIENKDYLLLDNNRLLVLDKHLKTKRVILRRPLKTLNSYLGARMCYARENGHLVVTWGDPYLHIYKIH